MVDNNILFTCIIPVFNGDKYLEETIESIGCQTIGREKIQLILIDDGSTDNTYQLMLGFENMFGQVDIIKNKYNLGVGKSLNLGMKKIRGDYTFFFGGDDLMDSNTLEEVKSFLESNEVEMVSVFIKRFGKDNNPMPKEERFAKGNRVIDVREEYIYPQILNGGCFFKSDTLINKEYNENLNHFADGDFMLKYVDEYGRYGVLNTATIHYRIKEKIESLSKNTKNSSYIFNTILEESLVNIVKYSKERHGGKVSKYIQTALTHRVVIILRRTKYQLDYNEEDRRRWFNDLKYILDNVEESVILENYILSLSEKSLMLNIKRNIPLSKNTLRYDNGSFYYEEIKLDLSLKDTFKIKIKDVKGKREIKVISQFFKPDEISLRIDSRFPFLVGDVHPTKISEKKYYLNNEEFKIKGCTLTFNRKLPFNRKCMYIKVGNEELKYYFKDIK